MSTTPMRLKAFALVTAISLIFLPAQAGFLDDFYSGSGTTTNITPGGIYQGQSSSVIAGGGLSARVPIRTFNPITFSPPTFSAGCGGIDLYLGAFGFPSGPEMTAFLRNVGQAAGGITFSIALKALSPELDSTINDFSKRISEMVQQYKNSCKAATALLEGVSGTSVAEMKKAACEYGRSMRNDDTQCETSSGDIGKVKEDAVKKAKQDPNSRLNPERNVVWRAINSVDYGSSLSTEEKQLIMSMTGSMIFTMDSATDSSALRTIPLRPLGASVDAMIDAIKGQKDVSSSQMDVYRCSHKSTAAPDDNPEMAINNCLTVTKSTMDVGGGFLGKLSKSKDAIVNGIIKGRSGITPGSPLITHYNTLKNASSMPLLKIVQASASQKNLMMSESMVDMFLDLAATEMTIRYLRHALAVIGQSGGFIAESDSKADKETMVVIMARYKDLSDNLNARDKTVEQQVIKINNALQIYDNVQRYMQASMGADMTRSLAMGR